MGPIFEFFGPKTQCGPNSDPCRVSLHSIRLPNSCRPCIFWRYFVYFNQFYPVPSTNLFFQQIMTTDGSTFDVVFVGTTTGRVLKVVNAASANSRSRVSSVLVEELQVQSLAQLFSIGFFVKKLLFCLEGKSMTPCLGNTFLYHSFQQLNSLDLSP